MNHKSLTGDQRERVVTDLCAWKVEESGFEISDDDIGEWRQYLESMIDSELSSTWFECVGEFLCSRGDMPGRDGRVPCDDGDELTGVQYDKLLAEHQSTDYGWVA